VELVEHVAGELIKCVVYVYFFLLIYGTNFFIFLGVVGGIGGTCGRRIDKMC